MELDDLKLAWQSLDRRLELHNALALHQLRETSAKKAQSGLRPLYWGQVLQMIFGVVVMAWAAAFWTAHTAVFHLMAVGLIMHVYGIVTVAFAARTVWLINRVDYASPVVAIQRQLAELRRFYVFGGLTVGMVWWVLWIPVMMMLLASAGADLYVHAPSVIYSSTAVGIVGLVASIWLIRWSQRPGRPRLARVIENALTGRSLRRAQSVVDEIRRFEQEDAEGRV